MAGYGTAIKRLRQHMKLTQDELAQRASVSRDTIIRAERSDNVGILMLVDIAEVLGVTITDFFGAGKVTEKPSLWALWPKIGPDGRARLEKLAKRYAEEG